MNAVTIHCTHGIFIEDCIEDVEEDLDPTKNLGRPTTFLIEDESDADDPYKNCIRRNNISTIHR